MYELIDLKVLQMLRKANGLSNEETTVLCT